MKRANAVAADLRLRILRRCVADPEAVGHDLPTRRRVHTTAVLAETPIRDTALLARFAWVAPDILTGCSDQISAWSASQKGHFATRFMAFIRGALRG
ncbi:hypothetical protein [Brevundimonas nasdae]|uniref:hypothetical protein n=1 Tax=Brevundimonas nasdae TaxID=172043 RepID=UPI003F68C9E8